VIKGICWDKDHFTTGNLKIGIESQEQGRDESRIVSWGVTPVHTMLQRRFWPNGRAYIPEKYILTIDGKVTRPPRSPDSWPGNHCRSEGR
jgi:hypothetical protein